MISQVVPGGGAAGAAGVAGAMAATKEELERWYEKVCVAGFADFDPVQFPRRFSQRQDAEIAAFLAAAIAWGRRDLILRSAEKMFAIMGGRPFDFVSSGKYRKLAQGGAGGNIHRTFFESDLKYFCRGFNRCFKRYDGTLENIFLRAGGVWQGIALFRDEMARANGGFYSKHIADPGAGEGGSACKRINLALRWLVRGGPVDLGLWKNISPASLFIPLDVHVSRTARSLGLLERRSNDKKAVMLLTEKLKVFCPDDPVKYDFALFGMGAIPQA